MTTAATSGLKQEDPAKDTEAVSFETVLDAEMDQVEISRRYRWISQPVPPRNPGAANEPFARAEAAQLAGLAFSGGGIRSATFNLGILQALAEAKALRRFDYLSTVSGGGYIGGWFAACVKRLQGSGDDRPRVESVLAAAETHASASKEPQCVGFLRRYSNYLTPRLGLLSGDTWAFIAAYVRNLFLNLLILVSSLTALLLLPWILDYITRSIRYELADHVHERVVIGLALLFFIIAVVFIGRNLITLGVAGGPRRFTSEKAIQLTVVLPLFMTAWLFSAWIYSFASAHPYLSASAWIGDSLIMNSSCWAMGSLLAWLFRERKGSAWQPAGIFWYFVGIVASGVAAGLLLWKIEDLAIRWSKLPGTDHPTWYIVGWIPPALIGVIAITFFIQIGIAGRRSSEDVREWFGRLCGYLTVNLLLWLALFAVAAPMLGKYIHGFLANVAGIAVWLGSTGAGLLLSRNKNAHGQNGGRESGGLKKLITSVAPYLFVTGMLILLSVIIARVHIRFNEARPSVFDIYACIAFALFSVLLSSRVDVNLFSMHALYGNRLVRCYLGASNPNRQPQPFTGFDSGDDLSLSDLAPSAGYQGPYPIVNTALNLVHGQDLAWQQRKAESFVFSPLYCGFNVQHDEKSTADSALAWKGYRPTTHYGYQGGPCLGTAMSISGAAAAPNMGYHSSPAMSFLLTVFNVRLGWWMGNPRHPRAWRHSAPFLGVMYLLNELVGKTRDTSAFVYLSDGGHFENLGVYELVRRRCSLILVCDAGQDGNFNFEDLAGVIEKCRTDFSVEIDLGSAEEIRPPSGSLYSEAHYAFGVVRYDARHTGAIVYLKASLTGEESVELASYQRAHPCYPMNPPPISGLRNCSLRATAGLAATSRRRLRRMRVSSK